MHKRILLQAIIALVFFTGCSVSKNYNPDKKFAPEKLQQDYTLLRKILEKKHPSLYWYTPKDSMDYYFDKGYQSINDSMTELQFGWQVLAPVINKIRCGHTSFSMSKNWYKYIQDKNIPSFPLFLKVFGDTMVVTYNLDRKDSVIKRGTIITSINGLTSHEVVQQLFNYLPLDGYSDNVNYIRISGNFPYYHRLVFGIYKNYEIGYLDSTGKEKAAFVHMFIPGADTAKQKETEEKISRRLYKKQDKEGARAFTIDSSIHTGVMSLNTFSKGHGVHLRSFFHRSFRTMQKDTIKNFILDLRGNGGGDIDMYVLLAKYLRKTPFKVCDTTYAVANTLSPYTKYINHGIFNNIGLFFLTHQGDDSNYHYGYWERHVFVPKSKNHFNGNIYVLINGPTFSASTLFCNAVKGQTNVKLVGEEAGGGWYGNNGIMIPEIKLPNTKVRVTLPVFRIVQFNHIEQKGIGVEPDIYIPPTVDGVRRGIDRKMLIVKGMIKAKQ